MLREMRPTYCIHLSRHAARRPAVAKVDFADSASHTWGVVGHSAGQEGAVSGGMDSTTNKWRRHGRLGDGQRVVLACPLTGRAGFGTRGGHDGIGVSGAADQAEPRGHRRSGELASGAEQPDGG